MIDSKKYYSKESVAKDYDNERFTSKAGQMFDMFEKNIVMSNAPKNVNTRVLDAGAGTGRFTIELAKKGYSVISCDQSSAMLKIIESKIESLNLSDKVIVSKQDITKLSFKDDSFDYIDCMRVFVNLDSKENISLALNELIRVCKPGGTILFDIVNPKSLARIGPQKDSMVTMNEMMRIISFNKDSTIEKLFGRRIFSQRAFEKCPNFLLTIFDKLDESFSNFFPQFSVRLYFIIRK